MLVFLVIGNKKNSKTCLVSMIDDFLFVSRPEVAEQSGDLSQIVPGPLFPR